MQPLVRQHLRSLARGVIPGVAVVVIGVFASVGPWSPLALTWADALSSYGNAQAAGAAYRVVAHMGVTESIRERAAFRVAMSTAVARDEPERAVRALSTYARVYPRGPGRGEALARLAELYSRELEAPLRAARAWRLATEADPKNPSAPDWLLDAAAALEGAGKDRRARALREQLARAYPEHAPDAWLASARMLLERGDSAGAYEIYQRVATSTYAGELRSLGRLGMSVCLERSGDLEGALAELDEASDGLPEDVWRQRRDRVRDRYIAHQRYEQDREDAREGE